MLVYPHSSPLLSSPTSYVGLLSLIFLLVQRLIRLPSPDGFTTRQTSGSGVTANTTTAKPGAPEETLSAIRLAGSRDIVLGLALRDSTA